MSPQGVPVKNVNHVLQGKKSYKNALGKVSTLLCQSLKWLKVRMKMWKAMDEKVLLLQYFWLVDE